MAVYVDEAVWRWAGKTWCHLPADEGEELHRFAARLGIRDFSVNRDRVESLRARLSGS